MIDIHTHIDAPLHGSKTLDDWYEGTVSAAFGGVTSVVDYPIQEPGQSLREVIENSMNNDNNRDSRNDNNKNNANSGVAGRNDGDYNVTRTSVDQTLNGGINTMTATTWMWIILIVAAVTIMAAIWYYATQGNK